jgi:hypothetical protein
MSSRSWVGAALLGWVVTRALVVWLLRGPHQWVAGDLAYYLRSITGLSEAGLAQTLVEYPLPGVAVVAAPWLLVGPPATPQAYGEAVLVLSLLADAAFTVMLARSARPRPRAGVVVWLLAVPLLGATAYARFDLVPGLLAGAALLLLADRPRLAAALAAVATGIKLWPAFVLPALAVPGRSRRGVTASVVVVGALLTGTTAAVAGWRRLFSPLTWQAERGLQVESVPATPAMVGRLLAPGDYEVVLAEHHAYEVLGPGVEGLLDASTVLSALAAVGMLALWATALRHGARITTETVSWLALAAVGLFVVTSKVLSPQYLLWLLPLGAVAAGVSRTRAPLAWAALLLVATAGTQLVFPELYGSLVGRGEHLGAAVLALAGRNLVLVALVGWACAAAARGVTVAARSSANLPDPRGTTSAAAAGERPTGT